MAMCQVALRRQEDPDLPFRKTYIYGLSTKNVHIERWWGELTDGQTEPWKRYFESLSRSGFFTGSKYDVIALRYLYMEPLKEQIQNFVDVHNIHRIGRQTTHDFPGGVPDEMYNYSTTPNFLHPHNNSSVFQSLKKQLHPDTQKLYTQLLQQAGLYPVDLNFIEPGLNQPHVEAYCYLREELCQAEINGVQIMELLPPTGGLKWIEFATPLEEAGEEAVDMVSEDEVEEDEQAQLQESDSEDDGVYVEP
ncbi:hypothetical protein F5884DRAFT_838194 [Xylogone sp. PMI_703]|nr:hypothetical protein F5884DRAFT_838194 [Xylogone sp. PMI_703]